MLFVPARAGELCGTASSNDLNRQARGAGNDFTDVLGVNEQVKKLGPVPDWPQVVEMGGEPWNACTTPFISVCHIGLIRACAMFLFMAVRQRPPGLPSALLSTGEQLRNRVPVLGDVVIGSKQGMKCDGLCYLVSRMTQVASTRLGCSKACFKRSQRVGEPVESCLPGRENLPSHPQLPQQTRSFATGSGK